METRLDSRIITEFTSDHLNLSDLKKFIERCERDGMMNDSKIKVRLVPNPSQLIGPEVTGDRITFSAFKPYYGKDYIPRSEAV